MRSDATCANAPLLCVDRLAAEWRSRTRYRDRIAAWPSVVTGAIHRPALFSGLKLLSARLTVHVERDRGFADSPLEEARFEPSVPLWLGAFTRSKTSMSGPVGVGGFEEGEFEGDGPLEKVAAQILLRGADAVQLRAQEIDEAAKPRIVVQRDPLGVHEIDRQRLRRAGGPVEIEPFGHDEDRKRGGIAARFCGLAHDRLEAGGRLRIGIGRAPVLRDAEGLERAG